MVVQCDFFSGLPDPGIKFTIVKDFDVVTNALTHTHISLYFQIINKWFFISVKEKLKKNNN